MQKPLEGVALGIITLALSLATFMQVLDSTIANVAIPTISGDLGASFSQGTWVITSFGVANAIAIPITGWLAKRFGEVKLFLIATALFVFASWLCGISHSLEMLILCRIFQGLAAGPIIPLSQSLLLNNYPPEKRGMALAFWSMTVVVAPIFGPILGGWISDNLHWGWIFFINVPIGFIIIASSWKIMMPRESEIRHQPIDTVGLVLLVLGVGCLQLMLDQGREQDWFNSTEIIILAVVSAVTLTALVIWELTDDNPVVDISLFKLRNFSVGCLSSSLAFLIYLGSVVLIPLLLQQVFGYTATWAGLASAPVGLFPILLSPLIGKFGYKIDMRILVTISFVVYAITFYWRAVTFEPNMAFIDVVLPQLVQGLAVACFFMPLTTITLSNLPAHRMASAASLFNFLRTLAGSDEETAEAVRRLEGGEFVTYMSLTCQNCPTVVQALNTMSVINPRIRHVAVEGGAFKDEVDALGIKAVPAIYKDGELFGQGRMDVADFVARLDSGAGARIAESLDAKDPFEVLVVGGGPAGATAAIYSARKALRTGLVATRFGGQVLDTMAIENFISVPHTEGPRLGAALEEHVRSHDVDITTGVKASALHPAGEDGLISVDIEGGGTLRARSVVLATGAHYRAMGVPGEEEYRNKGVTFCPHCDGPLFKGRPVAVIGGGNSGIEAAIDLAQVASHVTVVEFLDTLKADAVLVNRLRSLPNVDALTSTRVVEVAGDGSQVTGLDVEDRASGQVRRLDLEGVFVQIGLLPDTGWLDGVIERNRAGEIVVDQRGATSLPGVFAAGDCANTPYKQIVISLGSGATAALSAFDHLIRSQEEAETPTAATLRA